MEKSLYFHRIISGAFFCWISRQKILYKNGRRCEFLWYIVFKTREYTESKGGRTDNCLIGQDIERLGENIPNETNISLLFYSTAQRNTATSDSEADNQIFKLSLKTKAKELREISSQPFHNFLVLILHIKLIGYEYVERSRNEYYVMYAGVELEIESTTVFRS